MKKKLSQRDTYLVVGLLIIAVGYVFYQYLLTPISQKITDQKNMESQLTEQISSKDENALIEKQQNLSKEKQNFNTKLAKIKEEKNFKPVEYQELLTYLGQQADTLGVDIVKFSKDDVQELNSYWQVPYRITVQGDYKNIVQFINTLYKYDNYFSIDGMDLKQVSMIPMTDKVTDGNADLSSAIKYSWASDFIQKLDKSIPSTILATASTSDSSSDGSNTTTDNSNKKADTNFDEKVQLDFTFSFITLEEPVEKTNPVISDGENQDSTSTVDNVGTTNTTTPTETTNSTSTANTGDGTH